MDYAFENVKGYVNELQENAVQNPRTKFHGYSVGGCWQTLTGREISLIIFTYVDTKSTGCAKRFMGKNIVFGKNDGNV